MRRLPSVVIVRAALGGALLARGAPASAQVTRRSSLPFDQTRGA